MTAIGLFHDYLTQKGGAERVALVLAQEFKPSFLFTSVYDPGGTFPDFADQNILTSSLNRVAIFRRDPQKALPLLPRAFHRVPQKPIDVAICSSSGWAHSANTEAGRVLYMHTPARWLYEPKDYFLGRSPALAAGMCAAGPVLRSWDRRQLRASDVVIANSTVVRDRIERVYGREARVVHPPVAVETTGSTLRPPGVEDEYFLTVARGRGYKNSNLIAEAARQANVSIVVVGGSKEDSKKNVRYTGVVSESELRWLYANCRALIAMAHEDFGLTPIEANAFGRPVIALRRGGYLDTVIEGMSGIFCETEEPTELAGLMRDFCESDWDPASVRLHASNFTREAFVANLRSAAYQAVQ